jgi:prophage DNA circulation protein
LRNWQKTLRQASYRGAPFWVDFDNLSGGKRLALHEYAGGRTTTVEELGLVTDVFDITLYLIGDLADVQALALQTAMKAPGPGLLVLPIDGAMFATMQGFRRDRSKDRAGYIAFDASFVPASNETAAPLSIGDVTAVVAAGFAAAAAQFARFF